MSNDKITKDDLFAPGYEAEVVKGIETIVNSFKALEAQQLKNLSATKDLLASVKKISTADDLKATNRAFAESEKAISNLDKTRKAVAQGEKELAKARLEEIRVMKAREKAFDDFEKKLQKGLKIEADEKNAYIQKSKTLDDLRKKYLEVAAAKGTDAKEAKALLKQLQPLDKELKEISANAGRFQQNVGNYASAVSNIFGAAGITLGTAGIIGLGKSIIETRGEFQKLEAVLRNCLVNDAFSQAAMMCKDRTLQLCRQFSFLFFG